MRRELVKLLVSAVVLERDDDGQPVGELTSAPLACFNPEQAANVYAQAQVEVAEFNAAQPNRAARRSRKKEAT